MAVKEKFQQLVSRVKEDPSHISDLNVTYQFNLEGEDGGTYQLKFADQTVEYAETPSFDPEITLEMSDKNFLKLVEGDLNPTVAYMGGKLKVKGELGLALKLNSVLKKYQTS
ncbi:MAG: SCP2 sterol-binding domain-containing protein [Bacillus sp. (in: Bacteria)]|nr:SCP2 sterol-binding domain-containing protein [Bacillus sp. (in: firmicutes)]